MTKKSNSNTIKTHFSYASKPYKSYIYMDGEAGHKFWPCWCLQCGSCSNYFFSSFLLKMDENINKWQKKIIRTQSKLISHMHVNLTNLIHIWMDARVISFDLAYAYNADRVQIIFFFISIENWWEYQ